VVAWVESKCIRICKLRVDVSGRVGGWIVVAWVESKEKVDRCIPLLLSFIKMFMR